MNKLIIAAFLSCHNGYSPDRVVADPELNARYLKECSQAGIAAAGKELNKSLLNARKAGYLKGIKTSKRTSFKDEDEYCHASEIAIRFLEKRDNVTLDDIICDPARAREFDAVASDICPGYPPLQYRWAALNLRKSSKLKPELMSHVVRPESVKLGAVAELEHSELPTSQGLYIFYGGNDTLYVGEASNLRKRLEKHLKHSDNKELAQWFWKNGFSEVNLEIQELPPDTTKKVRKALEYELIGSRHPLFNVQRPN